MVWVVREVFVLNIDAQLVWATRSGLVSAVS